MYSLTLSALPTAPADADATGGQISAAQIFLLSGVATVVDGTDIVGTVVVQGSDDPPVADNMSFAPQGAPVNWVNLFAPIAVSGNVSVLLPTFTVSMRWVRVFWDYTSGSGGQITVNCSMRGNH